MVPATPRQTARPRHTAAFARRAGCDHELTRLTGMGDKRRIHLSDTSI
ncbi:MAG: hypothetical protein ACLTHL_03025 [Collinsella sp.]